MRYVMKKWSAMALAAFATSMSAWATGSSIGWKEEALLHDGRKVVVERFYNLGGYAAIDSRERQAIDEIVQFRSPDTGKTIIWKTDFRDAVPEPNSLNLLLLDIVNGTPYIATYPAGCIAYNKWKRPNPIYVFFKYEGDEWKRIPNEEFPSELVRTNIIVGRPPVSLLKSFYTAEQVDEKNYYLEREHKTILREPLPQARINEMCEPMVHYKCGWFGTNPDGTFNKEFADRMCNK